MLSLPAFGQSVPSIVEQMKARHQEQLEAVDNYVIETNFYTSYNRKTTQNGQPTYETVSRLKGKSEALTSFDSAPPTTTFNTAFLDRLAQHATLVGTETVNGTQSVHLHVENPSAVNSEVDDEARSMDFYVDAEELLVTRVQVILAASGSESEESTLTMDFTDYRTVKGLTVPYLMTMQMELGLSEEQRQQMQQLKKQLEQMPEQQREQMKRMMGDQFEQIEDVIAGGTTTIEVQSVRVNEGIPEGIFSEEDTER